MANVRMGSWWILLLLRVLLIHYWLSLLLWIRQSLILDLVKYLHIRRYFLIPVLNLQIITLG